MKTQGLFVITAMAILLAACQKEIGFDSPIVPDEDSTTNPVNNSDIKGNWKFLFADITFKSVTENNGIMGVASYRAITKDNGGILNIDASNCTGTDFTYAIKTDVALDVYVNGVKMDDQSQSLPINYTVPKYKFVSDYKLIGTDSIFLATGFSIPVQDANNVPMQFPESGAKYQIKSDTLILQSKSNVQQTVNQSGVNIVVNQSINGLFYFKRR